MAKLCLVMSRYGKIMPIYGKVMPRYGKVMSRYGKAVPFYIKVKPYIARYDQDMPSHAELLVGMGRICWDMPRIGWL